MNNLLKTLFLIINLFSSTTSAVNNSSLPLSTDLKTGQNVSQIVKREGAINVQGGSRILGFSRGLLCQRPCTISFPVSLNNDKKGFLVSFICVENSVFTVKGHSTLIGHVEGAYNYKPELGLEYAHISIHPDFWSDDISHKIPYSHCAKSGQSIVDVDESLPIIPVPNSPLSVGDEVYAHGGVSGMVKGVVLATGVTITVDRPGSCGSETEQFHDVVKVKMDKPYAPGNLGSPVYIPLPVPDSNQMIVSPVGQVIEDSNWNTITGNIWYYIPLDRILKDGNLKIESGDLSYLLPKPEEPNNEDLNNVPLTDNLTASSNTSEIAPHHLDKRQVVRKSMQAGRLVGISSDPREWRDDDKRCTLGFPVSKVGNAAFNRGFLTLANCLSTDIINNQNGIFSFPSENFPGVAVRSGFSRTSDLVYRRFFGLNFALVILLNDPSVAFIRSVKIRDADGMTRTVDLVNHPFLAAEGNRVCVTTGHLYGEIPQIICGTVTGINEQHKVLNPWRWASLVRLIVLGLSPAETWRNLIKVRLDAAPQDYASGVIGRDHGSPVYFPITENGRITRAQPVGILFDYERRFENVGDRCEEVYYMYCISVNLIMANYGPELSLIGVPPQ